MSKILIVEDEKAIRNVLKKIISAENAAFQVDEAENGLEAYEKIKVESFDLILCDIKMPKMDGVEFLDKCMALNPDTTVVMISGHGDIETAVECMRKGAFDFISKPPDLNHLMNTLRNGLDRKTLIVENKRLKKKVNRKYEMIGESPKLKKIQDMIEKVAVTDARVLITGDNGTGKELIAHWIHEKSNRSKAPLIEVNCAAIPAELIESELFGHEKGAFTSAVKQRKGKFEIANGGTLFLDEVGDMSLSAQAKVLRVLQEHKISRVGGDKSIKVDVRVLAATNKDLKKEIAEGNFREDLYHRLGVILIHNPALDDRKEDIPLLINHFAKLICNEQGVALKTFSDEAFEKLKAFNWSGNIRELRNVVERLIILSQAEITAEDVDMFAGK
ncbi:MAG: sigma-54-dependent transcriptional regulator [Flavobacteriales bacterium]